MKHQEETNNYATKPRVVANVVTPSVCNDESLKCHAPLYEKCLKHLGHKGGQE